MNDVSYLEAALKHGLQRPRLLQNHVLVQFPRLLAAYDRHVGKSTRLEEPGIAFAGR